MWSVRPSGLLKVQRGRRKMQTEKGREIGAMSDGRIDFDSSTRRVIAMRSGYRCAHPECNGRTTVGPAKQPDKSEDTGRASHIFSASKRGPRGQGNLSPEELRSVANGIWLCSEHANQVDTNNGRDYPPPVLLSWKALHEYKIAREHGAMLYPFGGSKGFKSSMHPCSREIKILSSEMRTLSLG